MRIKFAPDKWKHFWVGIPLGIVLEVVSQYYFSQTMWAITASIIILVIICYGFELFSLITKLGHHDIMDAVAGVLGGVIGICIVLIQKILHLF